LSDRDDLRGHNSDRLSDVSDFSLGSAANLSAQMRIVPYLLYWGTFGVQAFRTLQPNRYLTHNSIPRVQSSFFMSASKKQKASDSETEESPAKKMQKKSVTDKPKKEKKSQLDYFPKTWDTSAYPQAKAGNLKIISWNVAGLNACVNKGFKDYVSCESPDILCINEHKLQESKKEPFDEIMKELGYVHRYWTFSTVKNGYSGVGIFVKDGHSEPLSVLYGLGEDGWGNQEGRTISIEMPSFFLVNSYVPNSGSKLERLKYRELEWDPKMLAHLQFLEAKGKPVILSGDLNVAHEEIDLKNPKTNKNKSAGFCDEERHGMSNYIAAGYDDTFRRLYPDSATYSYYGMRFDGYGKGTGWRLDYFLASQSLRDKIDDTSMRTAVYGASDHVPIMLEIEK
jgi:exodeoxyribonuclease III